jgi:hypothetical protein
MWMGYILSPGTTIAPQWQWHDLMYAIRASTQFERQLGTEAMAEIARYNKRVQTTNAYDLQYTLLHCPAFS